MDTSETYIKMCDCPEIQALRDRCYLHKSAMGEIVHGFDGSFYYGKPQDKVEPPFVVPMPLCVWLPRQGQLQEMSGFQWNDFDEECLRVDEEHNGEIASKEQAGIMVVMKEKYNKVWDGKKWVEDAKS